MPPIESDYALSAVQFTLSDLRLSGFGEEDGIAVAPNAEIMSYVVSGDGANVATSYNSDNTHTATLTLQRGTAAYARVAAMMQSQIAAARVGAVPNLPFSLYDPSSGDKVSERKARFLTQPELTFNKSSSEAVFTILLPNPDIEYGANVVLTA